MATFTHSTGCPVAALACEATLLVEALKRLDNLSLETSGHKLNEVERQFDAVEAQIYALGTSASHLRASSTIGVLFQLHQIASLVDVMANPVGDEDEQERTRRRAEAAINRLLYSARDAIEQISGENAYDACGSYYMPRELNPHAMIEIALRAEKSAA